MQGACEFYTHTMLWHRRLISMGDAIMLRWSHLSSLLLSLALVGCNRAEEEARKKEEIQRIIEDHKKQVQEAEDLQEAERRIAEIKVEYGTLLGAFLADFDAAHAKYGGRKIEVTGNVVFPHSRTCFYMRGEKTAAESPHIQLVPCNVAGESANKVMALFGGQQVRVVGRLGTYLNKGKKFGKFETRDQITLSFHDCYLEEVEPTSTLVVSAEELGREFERDRKSAIEKYRNRSVLVNGTVVSSKEGHAGRIGVLELKGTDNTKVWIKNTDQLVEGRLPTKGQVDFRVSIYDFDQRTNGEVWLTYNYFFRRY